MKKSSQLAEKPRAGLPAVTPPDVLPVAPTPFGRGFAGGLVRAGEMDRPPARPGEGGELLDFVSVEARLVEAFEVLRRLPDPAPGPQLRMMALWREVVPDRTDIDQTPSAARPGVSRYELARMEEALGWCEWLPPERRKVVGAVVTWQASGRGEIRWTEIRRIMKVQTTTEGLRKAYSRALQLICGKLNAGR